MQGGKTEGHGKHMLVPSMNVTQPEIDREVVMNSARLK